MIVGIRLSRRLIAVVGLDDEVVTFHESRFVPSNAEIRERTTRAYFQKILEQLQPTRICYYAPTSEATAADQLTKLLAAVAASLLIATEPLSKDAVFGSCALDGKARRSHLHDVASNIWSGLPSMAVDRQLALSEAFICALVGDTSASRASP